MAPGALKSPGSAAKPPLPAKMAGKQAPEVVAAAAAVEDVPLLRRRKFAGSETELQRLGGGSEELEALVGGQPLSAAALEEEQKLALERVQAPSTAAGAVPPGGAVLDNKKFKALESLLQKSEIYTRFLAEQLGNMEDRCDADAREYHAQQEEAAKAAATHSQLLEQHAQASGTPQRAAASKGKASGSSSNGVASTPTPSAAAAPAATPGSSGKRGRATPARGGAAAKRGRGTAEAEGGAAAATAAQEGEQPPSPDEPAAKVARSAGRTPTQELLPLLNADLRDYQIKGVKWLISCWSNGVNGILADEMGLGKTVQTLGFLSHLKLKGINGPFMIVGPLSTLSNWMNETRRFLPCLTPLLYHGSKQERADLRAKHLGRASSSHAISADFPLIITSFEIVIADAKFFSRMRFKYVVVDEGHRLKNHDCRLVRELKTIPMDNRLLLTGTPLQNNLAELWSLLNVIMPDIFSSMADFESWFDFSAVGQEGASEELLRAEQRNKVISKLHSILKPFVLRRLKSDVQLSLPRKMEIILYAGMTETQRSLNRQMMDNTLMEQMATLAERNGGRLGAAGSLNNILMQMRKNCNHPDLITSAFSNEIMYPTAEELLQQCGKLQLLDTLLKELKQRGHKVLIFSQMTKMLNLIETLLEQQGHGACRIDGSVPWQERQASINSFNEDPNAWIFLLSTRAGGLGINLTAADTVIIYDSDWNPHQDMQAMDRCHRIGQQAPVLVLRLVTAHSVEGKMLKRAGDKMALERIVIKKGAFQDLGAKKEEKDADEDTNLSLGELQEMLQGSYKMHDVPQSGVVSQKTMMQLLDRSHLMKNAPPPFPMHGVGYEVVQSTGSHGMLKHIEEQQ